MSIASSLSYFILYPLVSSFVRASLTVDRAPNCSLKWSQRHLLLVTAAVTTDPQWPFACQHCQFNQHIESFIEIGRDTKINPTTHAWITSIPFALLSFSSRQRAPGVSVLWSLHALAQGFLVVFPQIRRVKQTCSWLDSGCPSLCVSGWDEDCGQLPEDSERILPRHSSHSNIPSYQHHVLLSGLFLKIPSSLEYVNLLSP